MTTTHTPGPWLRDEAGRGTYMVFQAGSEGDGTLVCSNVKSEADARLIAAAPAMLAALQKIVDRASRPIYEDSTGQPMVQLRAALIEEARAVIETATKE